MMLRELYQRIRVGHMYLPRVRGAESQFLFPWLVLWNKAFSMPQVLLLDCGCGSLGVVDRRSTGAAGGLAN